MIAVVQSQIGDLSGALKIADSINEGNRSDTFGKIAQARGAAGDMKGALEAIERIQSENFTIRKDTFRMPMELFRGEYLKIIALDQAKAGNIELARQTASLIPAAAGMHIEEALEGIALAQARAKDSRGAIVTATAIKDSGSRSLALRKLAGALARAGDAKSAVQVARGLPDESDKGTALYGIAEAQVQNGDIVGARQTLKEAIDFSVSMQHEGSKSSLIGHLAKVQAMTGDVQGAMKAAAALPNNVPKLGPSWRDKALQGLAESLAAIGDVQGAQAAISSIQNESARNIAMGAVVWRLSKLGDTKSALEVAQMIHDEQTKASAFYGVALGQAKYAGDLPAALKTALGIKEGQYKNLALKEVAEAQAKTVDIQGALRTASLLEQEPYRTYAFGAISEARAKNGDFKGALQTAASEREYERASTLKNIARIQTEAGDPLGALAWSETRATPWGKTLALIGVAQGIAKPKAAR
jgi:hypothetical protein